MAKLLTDEQARQVLRQIAKLYPDAKGELNWDTNFHLLCAVMMSAQTTDKMVNQVTVKFNQDFPTAKSLAAASITEIEADIARLGLYHSKAKHLKEMAVILVNQYNGQVPANFDELVKLPGVGEKTASVVLAEAFKIPAIAVDTHVSRIAKAFGIVKPNATPHEIKLRLESLLPEDEWIHQHHAMIFFGRYTMTAKSKNQDPFSYLPEQRS